MTTPQTCQACGLVDTGMVRGAIERGVDVWMCPDPIKCRQRAQAAGIWKAYEPRRTR